MSKETIRETIIEMRTVQVFSGKKKKDKKILTLLNKLPVFRDAKEFFTYLSHKGEVSTDLLLKKYFRKKIIVVPKVKGSHIHLYELHDNSKFSKGKFGIREPDVCLRKKDFKSIDVAIIPGIAFDKTGHRVGFGGGYFDRFLKKLHCTTIGLAYEFQIVDKIPIDKYDMAVDYVVTEKRIIRCKKH